jgi:hypothetical protein
MYQQGNEVRTAHGGARESAGPASHEAARQAVARIRKLLEAYKPGQPCDRPRLQAALGVQFADDAQEAKRLWALGWLG